MTTNMPATSRSAMLGASGIRWGWLLALGILMTVLGVIGLGMTYWLTLVAVFWLGVFAIIGGVAQIIDAFRNHKGWGGFVWHVIIGIVYILAGIVMITMPISAAFWLTLFIAASLVVVGVLRIVMAFQVRGQGSVWLWVLVSGIISIVLGIMVYGTMTPPSAEALATPEAQLAWLRSWGWVIGLFVAIEFIMEGLSLIAIALTKKSADDAEGGPVATPAG